MYWAIPTWLDGPAALERPADIAPRGTMTIADIADPAVDDHNYPDRVRLWAHAVWAAYAVQHDLARRRLDAARLHKVRGGARSR